MKQANGNVQERRRRFFDAAFKAQAIALVETGAQTVKAIALEIGVHESVLRGWMRDHGIAPPTRANRVPSTQPMLLPQAAIEALRPEAIAKFQAGRPKETKALVPVKATSPFAAEDLEALQRIRGLAQKAGMTTKEFVDSLIDLAVVDGIGRKPIS